MLAARRALPGQVLRGRTRKDFGPPRKRRSVGLIVVSAPKAITLEDMVQVMGARWAIEECFEVGKGELGLDQYEVRSWAGWHRPFTLVMWLQALLSVLRSAAAASGCRAAAKKGAESKPAAPLHPH